MLNGAFGIIMDVNTGEVLGMASLGGYDPNQYLEIYDEDTAAALEEQYLQAQALPEGTQAREDAMAAYNAAVVTARLAQWRNRCVSDGYEPGSTFKSITLAAALEEGVVTLDDTFYCQGWTNDIVGRVDRLDCWKHTGHGMQTTAQTLANSCNIAFAEIGIRLGGEKFYEYAQLFGLMEKTGIDLPGEGTGYFFDKSLLTDFESYGYSSLTSGAFGQTFKVTPIQLVRAISAVVNGGYLLEPYVVSQVLDSDGEIVSETETTVLRQVISEETSATMRELLIGVVEEGTGGNARVVGYTIGGKTGTSEKIDVYDENGQQVDDKIVSFVGIAFDEAHEAKYICLVALDTPSTATGLYISGGVMAAPTARDILTDVLPYLGMTPNYADEEISQINVTMPNCIGLTESEAAKALQDKSLTYRVVGSGTEVTGQIPSEGSSLPGASEVILYMGEEVPTDKVEVPDFYGMTLSQANTAATNAGLYLQSKGSSSSTGTVSVTSQDIDAGDMVARGTTITVELTDHSAQD